MCRENGLMATKRTSELMSRMESGFPCGIQRRMFFCAVLLRVGLGIVVDVGAADIKKGVVQKFETLSLHDEAYTNAVVEGVGANVVFIRHGRGIAVVKIKDLTFEEARTLGIESMLPPPPAPKPDPARALNEQWRKVMAMISGVAGAGVGLALLAAIPAYGFRGAIC